MLLSPQKQPNLRRCHGRLALAALVLATVCTTSARGQIGGIDPDPGDRGSGGRNTIQGTIFLPGGRRFDRRAKVRLVSNVGIDQFQMSDDNGAFTFRRQQGGRYTVIVDAGREYESATETVDIPQLRRNDPPQTQSVYITLHPKNSEPTSKPGTVDASKPGVPDEARRLYTDAVESARTGDNKKAVEELKQAIALYPNFMTALNELGVQYMNLKEWKKAAASLREALKIGPDAFHPRLNYGIVLLQLKDYKAAAAELQIAVQKDVSSATAHFQLGRALVNLSNYDGAEKALKQAISIDADDSIEAHRYLAAVYIEKRNHQAAADELEVYLRLAPKAKDAEQLRTVIRDLRGQASKNN